MTLDKTPDLAECSLSLLQKKVENSTYTILPLLRLNELLYAKCSSWCLEPTRYILDGYSDHFLSLFLWVCLSCCLALFSSFPLLHFSEGLYLALPLLVPCSHSFSQWKDVAICLVFPVAEDFIPCRQRSIPTQARPRLLSLLLGLAEAVDLAVGEESGTQGSWAPNLQKATVPSLESVTSQVCLMSQETPLEQLWRARKGSEVVPHSAPELRSDQTVSASQDLTAPSTQGQANTAPWEFTGDRKCVHFTNQRANNSKEMVGERLVC